MTRRALFLAAVALVVVVAGVLTGVMLERAQTDRAVTFRGRCQPYGMVDMAMVRMAQLHCDGRIVSVPIDTVKSDDPTCVIFASGRVDCR